MQERERERDAREHQKFWMPLRGRSHYSGHNCDGLAVILEKKKDSPQEQFESASSSVTNTSLLRYVNPPRYAVRSCLQQQQPKKTSSRFERLFPRHLCSGILRRLIHGHMNRPSSWSWTGKRSSFEKTIPTHKTRTPRSFLFNSFANTMTRCPFALTTTALLAAVTVVLYSAGQSDEINAKVHWFLNHHVKNTHLRRVIEFATVQGGAYYTTLVFLAHVLGYLVAVNGFHVSHATAGQTVGMAMAVVGGMGCVVGAVMMLTTTTTTSSRSSSSTVPVVGSSTNVRQTL